MTIIFYVLTDCTVWCGSTQWFCYGSLFEVLLRPRCPLIMKLRKLAQLGADSRMIINYKIILSLALEVVVQDISKIINTLKTIVGGGVRGGRGWGEGGEGRGVRGGGADLIDFKFNL